MPTIRFKGGHNDDGTAAEFIEGVPARHLSDEDYDALDADHRKAVRESGLYDYETFRKAQDKERAAADKPKPADTRDEPKAAATTTPATSTEKEAQ